MAFPAGGGRGLHGFHYQMSANQLYLVSYDISNPRRLRHVARIMAGYGHRLQYSVFESRLNALRYEELKAVLHTELNHDEDQVLFVALGPDSGKISLHIESLGRPYVGRTRVTII